MTTTFQFNPISMIIATRLAKLVSEETRRLMNLGRHQGWDIRVLGQAPMPTEPVKLGDWVLVPADQDSSPIPSRAMRRVRTIKASGIRLRGFVVAHESPKLLKAPDHVQTDNPRAPTLRIPALSPKVKSFLKVAVGAFGMLVIAAVVLSAVAMAVAAIAAVAVLALPLALAGTLILVDPILVAVTEDGYWIEIDRWDS